MFVGLVTMPLVPGPRDPGLSEYAFRLSPFIAACLINLLAAWLRTQEALDPAREHPVSGSLLVHFFVYTVFTASVGFVGGWGILSLAH